MNGENLNKRMELFKETFLIERNTVVELLDDIQEFEKRMKKFNSKHDNAFSYKIDIERGNKLFIAKLKMKDNRC